jgi:hypothetical protein
MKTAFICAVLLTTLVSLQAADKSAPLTPRAQGNAPRVGRGEDTETLDRSFRYGSARVNENALSRRASKGGTTNTLDRRFTGADAKALVTKPSKTLALPPPQDK